MDPIMLTRVATGLSVLAGAVIVKQVINETSIMGLGRAPKCPSCNGSGRVRCLCSRWSDGDDAGCRTCGGSIRMTCSSCGGTEIDRPISVRIPASRHN